MKILFILGVILLVITITTVIGYKYLTKKKNIKLTDTITLNYNDTPDYILNPVNIQTQNSNNISIKSKSNLKLIPRIIYQTWKDDKLPSTMKKASQLIQSSNPNFEYRFFTDDDCRKFIKTHFSDNEVWAFDKLKPGAYKSDLWRYCALYVTGGIYLDIKYYPVDNFSFESLLDNEYFVRDRSLGGEHGIYQAFLVTYPKNPIMKKCIADIVENVKSNTYIGNREASESFKHLNETTNYHSLAITGPMLMSKYFYQDTIKSLSLTFDGKSIYAYDTNKNQRKILTHDSENYYKELESSYKKHKLARYTEMWSNANIYNYPLIKNETNNINKLSLFGLIDFNEYYLNISQNCELVLLDSVFNVIHKVKIPKLTKFSNVSLYKSCNGDVCFKGVDSKTYTFGKLFDVNDFNRLFFPSEIQTYKEITNYEQLSYPFDTIQIDKIECSQFYNTSNELKFIKLGNPSFILSSDFNLEKYINLPRLLVNGTIIGNGIEIDNEVWFLIKLKQSIRNHTITTHNIQYAFFSLDKETYEVIKYSEPFKFDNDVNKDYTSFFTKDDIFNIVYSNSVNKECGFNKISSEDVEKLKWNEV